MPRQTSSNDLRGSGLTTNLQMLPEPEAKELLAPPPSAQQSGEFSGTIASPASISKSAANDSELELYPDQPEDLQNPNADFPRNADAERSAWHDLLAFINAYKDDGTIVEAADPETFMTGFE